MDGFTVRQKDNPKLAIFHLRDLNPAPNSTVRLPRLPNWRGYGALHPVVRDHCAIWASPHGVKVGGGLHSENLTDCEGPGQCRRTAPISDRTLTVQYAVAPDL